MTVKRGVGQNRKKKKRRHKYKRSRARTTKRDGPKTINTMRPFRNLKMASVIQEELGKLFARELNFNGALVTILDVTVDEKLEEARVKLGIIPFEKELEIYTMMEGRRRGLEHALVRKLNVKPMPRLKFEIASKGGV